MISILYPQYTSFLWKNEILMKSFQRKTAPKTTFLRKKCMLDCNASSIQASQKQKMQLLEVLFWWTTKMSTYMTTTHYNKKFHHLKYFQIYININIKFLNIFKIFFLVEKTIWNFWYVWKLKSLGSSRDRVYTNLNSFGFSEHRKCKCFAVGCGHRKHVFLTRSQFING